MEAQTYLFAYGTLLTGTGSTFVDGLVKAYCRPLGRGYIRGALYCLGGYPGVVALDNTRSLRKGRPSDETENRVYGWVFAVQRARTVFATLDRYEGYHPQCPRRSEFLRRRTPVTPLPCKRPLMAWAYYYSNEPGSALPILSGDYLDAADSRPRRRFRKDHGYRTYLRRFPGALG